MNSVSDVANRLGMSAQHVRNLCRDGKLVAERVGRSWIISDKHLNEYVSANGISMVKNHGRKKTPSNHKPKVLSFFSGAMGLDLGLEKAGFETILACEIDKACRKTITTNKPDIALLGSISEYSAGQVMAEAGMDLGDEVDLIVGGPPCQAFSTAGKRRGFSDERGNVFLTYIDLVLRIKPKYFVIENVRGLLSCPMEHRPHSMRGEGYPDLGKDELKGGALHFVIERLKSSGYSVSFNLYNSANFGTPQIRERVILICSRDGRKVPYLEPTHAEYGEAGLPPWRTFRQAVEDLREDHTHLKFPEKRLKYYRRITEGNNWRSLPIELQKEALGKSYYSGGGKTGFLRRLSWDKPSPTVVTHPAMPATDLAHPIEDRPLSIEEYKRIQEFPDGWRLCGSLIDQYKQVGNAVPVSLGMAVGSLIMKHMKGLPVKSVSGFKYSRYKNTDDVSWLKDFSQRANAKSEKIEKNSQAGLFDNVK